MEVHFSSHLSAQSVPEHAAISPTLRNRARRAAGRSSTAAKNTIPPRSPHPQAVGTPGKNDGGLVPALRATRLQRAANEVIFDKSMMCVHVRTYFDAVECTLRSPGTPVHPHVAAIRPTQARKRLRERREARLPHGIVFVTANEHADSRTRSPCCALAARGQAAAPPRTVMNSRR